MPNHATTTLNINWFYQKVADNGEDIEYLPSPRITGTDEERRAFSKARYEEYIENEAQKYINAKIWCRKMSFGLDYDAYENIWDFLDEAMRCYLPANEVVIKNIEDAVDSE